MTSEKPIAPNKTRWTITILGLVGGLVVLLSVAFGGQLLYQPAVYKVFSVRANDPWLAISSAVGLAAPVAGLFADKVGRRKVMVAAAVLGILFTLVIIFADEPLIVGIGQIGQAVTAIFFYPALVAYLFEATWSRWLLASVMGLYLGIQTIANGAGQVLAPLFSMFGMDTPLWLVLAIGSVVLIGIGIGTAFLAHAYHLRRQYDWPEEWVQPDRRRFWIAIVIQVMLLRFLLQLANTAANQHFFRFASEEADHMSLYSAVSLLGVIVGLIVLVSGPGADWLDWYLIRKYRRAGGHLLVLGLGLLLLSLGALQLLSPHGSFQAVAAMLVVDLGAQAVGPLFAAILTARAQPRYWGLVAGASMAMGTLGALAGQSAPNGVIAGALAAAILVWAVAAGMNWFQPAPGEKRPETVAELFRLG